jgi:hypothetical protein
MTLQCKQQLWPQQVKSKNLDHYTLFHIAQIARNSMNIPDLEISIQWEIMGVYEVIHPDQ